MNYSALLNGLSNEVKNNSKLKKMNIVVRILLTIIFIPLFISFFFAKLFFWFTMFFFKMLAAPAEYLGRWLTDLSPKLHSKTDFVIHINQKDALAKS